MLLIPTHVRDLSSYRLSNFKDVRSWAVDHWRLYIVIEAHVIMYLQGWLRLVRRRLLKRTHDVDVHGIGNICVTGE